MIDTRLEEVKIEQLGKHSLGSLFHKVMLLGKKLFEWKFFLTNRIQMEYRIPSCKGLN